MRLLVGVCSTNNHLPMATGEFRAFLRRKLESLVSEDWLFIISHSLLHQASVNSVANRSPPHGSEEPTTHRFSSRLAYGNAWRRKMSGGHVSPLAEGAAFHDAAQARLGGSHYRKQANYLKFLSVPAPS
jgi:hypothetical protein